MALKEALGAKIDGWRPRTTRLIKEFGDVKVSDVTMSQAIGGARGVRCLVTDISYLDPNEGIRFRGYTIPETLAKLPKVPGKEMPYVEGHIYLLLTGDIPTEEDVAELAADIKRRGRRAGLRVRHLAGYADRYASDDHVLGRNPGHATRI